MAHPRLLWECGWCHRTYIGQHVSPDRPILPLNPPPGWVMFINDYHHVLWCDRHPERLEVSK